MHNLGVSYYKGLGITEDKAKAFKYFSQSAELGLLQSQVIVAGLLYSDEGVTKDHKKAFEWALKAANQGDVESQNNIGLAYENGDGVAKDPVLAKK